MSFISAADLRIYMLVYIGFVSYLVLTLIIRRFQEQFTIFTPQFSCYFFMLSWTVLHILNHYISDCWVICKLYGFFLHLIRLCTILFIREKLQWHNPDLYLGADWRSNERLIRFTNYLTLGYAGFCVYWSFVRKCSKGPHLCLPNETRAYQAGMLLFLSNLIQLILAREFFQKSRLLRQRLGDSSFWMSEEIVKKITMYNYTCMGIICTDVIFIIVGIVYMIFTPLKTYEQLVDGLSVLNV